MTEPEDALPEEPDSPPLAEYDRVPIEEESVWKREDSDEEAAAR